MRKSRIFEQAEVGVRIADRHVGAEPHVFVVAEIGINHNGSVEIAKQIIDGAARAGADAVKFQKRTPEKCVPRDQWSIERDTPWGRMTYIDYRYKVEFGEREYAEIDKHCRERGILWFASCWDEEAVDFCERFDPPCYKAASASLTDHALLQYMKGTGRPLMISTGMSTMEEIEAAVDALGTERLLVAHSTSLYPCDPDHLNLRMIGTLKDIWPMCPVGYSGHERGLAPTLAAVAMGATFVERHVTVDRAMWGSDQSASLELADLAALCSQIRELERSFGDGVKRVHEKELAQAKKLRRVQSSPEANGEAARPSARLKSTAA